MRLYRFADVIGPKNFLIAMARMLNPKKTNYGYYH